MNEQITEIINTLSAKLGVASQYIVTEMAKYKIASCSLTEIVTWMVAPTGSMINYILNEIK